MEVLHARRRTGGGRRLPRRATPSRRRSRPARARPGSCRGRRRRFGREMAERAVPDDHVVAQARKRLVDGIRQVVVDVRSGVLTLRGLDRGGIDVEPVDCLAAGRQEPRREEAVTASRCRAGRLRRGSPRRRRRHGTTDTGRSSPSRRRGRTRRCGGRRSAAARPSRATRAGAAKRSGRRARAGADARVAAPRRRRARRLRAGRPRWRRRRARRSAGAGIGAGYSALLGLLPEPALALELIEEGDQAAEVVVRRPRGRSGLPRVDEARPLPRQLPTRWIASATADGSSASTTSPASPSCSAAPGTSATTTGQPSANASSGGRFSGPNRLRYTSAWAC